MLKSQQLFFDRVKSIAFQLIYALMVAQGENEFAHLDLHLKNILLQTLEANQVLEYNVGGKKFRCASFMVKIADFGLSRITTDDGQVVFNDRQPLSDFFDVCKRKDVEMIEAHLLRIGRAAFESDARQFGGIHAVPVDHDVSIDWSTLTRLRSRMRGGEPLASLLDDDFFDSLRVAARKPLPTAAAANTARSRAARKSLGGKSSAVVVETSEPVVVPALQSFAYEPRVAVKANVPPATTAHRHRTRSVHKEEQMQRCVSEKTRGNKQQGTNVDDSENDSPNGLSDIRKRLSFANAK
jgi:hypothetical protein